MIKRWGEACVTGAVLAFLITPALAKTCTTETTDEVTGTAVSYVSGTAEVSSATVTYGQTAYLRNDAFTPSCRNISNNSTPKLTLYVPAANQSEWNSFVSAPPAGVSLSECTFKTNEVCTEDVVADVAMETGGYDANGNYTGSGPYNAAGTKVGLDSTGFPVYDTYVYVPPVYDPPVIWIYVPDFSFSFW